MLKSAPILVFWKKNQECELIFINIQGLIHPTTIWVTYVKQRLFSIKFVRVFQKWIGWGMAPPELLNMIFMFDCCIDGII